MLTLPADRGDDTVFPPSTELKHMTPDGAPDRPDLSVVDLDHVALRVSDLDRALDFYHGLLGLPVVDRGRYDRGEVPYVGVVAGGRNLHLVPDEAFAGGPAGERASKVGDDAKGGSANHAEGNSASGAPRIGGEHVCLLVRSERTDSRAELETLLAELEAAGVEIESGEPRERYGAYGRAWAAYVRDPDGRRVELKMH